MIKQAPQIVLTDDMKHRIAIYSNGYNGTITLKAIEGIKRYASIKDFDIHFYISFAANNRKAATNEGQLNIYNLAKLEEYDGLIVFSNLLNNIPTAEKLCREAKEKGIPIVSIGMKIDDIPYVGNNNRNGMKELVEHLITGHNVKSIVFIGGARDHVDTIDRARVVREVMESHGLKLKDEDVYYGDWINEKPIEITNELVRSEKGLPDAIVCANDIMALAVTSRLIELGYDLPNDVIVTGFDHIGEGDFTYPALTTVDQDYESIGYKSCELLYEIIEGKDTDLSISVSSKLIVGESCGCNNKADSRFNIFRREYCRGIHAKNQMSSFFNRFMRTERETILEAYDYDDMKERLRAFYLSNNDYFKGNFFLMLNKYYFEDAASEDYDALSVNFEADFDTTVALQAGKEADDEIDNRLRMPGFRKTEGEQHIYFFYPLQNAEYNYGYVVFVDGTYIIQEDFRISEYLEKMEQTLMQFRINMRLEMVNKELRFLYDKDPMTGLYNRFCFVSHAVPLVEESKEHRKYALIMFVDINDLKKINDRYGHVFGDMAITTVAEAVKESIGNDNAIGIRYGGDEFIVIAANASKKYAEDIKRSIISYIEKENRLGINPVKFSVSIGYVLTDPKSDKSVNDYVDEADKLMYEIKNEYHKKNGNPD